MRSFMDTRQLVLLSLLTLTLALLPGPGRADEPPAAAKPAANGPRVIHVKVTFVQVAQKTAAEWGLDGGPAPNPAATPLKKDIPEVLQPEELRTLFTALRERPETVILGTASVITMSGQTATTVRATGLPTSDPSGVQYDAMSLVVTPTVADDLTTIDVELKPTLSKLVGWVTVRDEKKPCIASVGLETHALLQSRQSMLIGAVLFALPPATLGDGAAAVADPRPVLIFLTAALE